MTNRPDAKDLNALVDRLVLDQGRLDPIELLLAAEALAYEDYEAWRLGRLPDLQSVLRIPPGEAATLLDRGLAYARGQGLAATPLHHRGWGTEAGMLTIGTHQALVLACSEIREPADDRRQLDLFLDNRALVAESHLCEALVARRPEHALTALRDLQAAEPGHRRLRDYLRLIQVLETGLDAPANPKTRLAELQAMEPLANGLLRHRTRDFLAPLWLALAEALGGRSFDPLVPDLHAAPAYVRAARWSAARSAVEAEPDWRRHPTLIQIHAEACRRALDHLAARRDWFGLCWDHPGAAARALDARDLPDPSLARQWVRFCDLDPPLDTTDFPAWLLCAEPGLHHAVPADAAPAGPQGEGFRLLRRLVGGEDTLSVRKALNDANPVLLRVYLAAAGSPKS